MNRDLTDTQAVETVYALASALLDAAKKLDKVPCGLRHEVDAVLDAPVCPGDLSSLAKALESLADEWQGEIDTAQAHYDEAEDRRRDNPLEPDFRRLGQ